VTFPPPPPPLPPPPPPPSDKIDLRLRQFRLLSYGLEWTERRGHIGHAQRLGAFCILPLIPYTEQTASSMHVLGRIGGIGKNDWLL